MPAPDASSAYAWWVISPLCQHMSYDAVGMVPLVKHKSLTWALTLIVQLASLKIKLDIEWQVSGHPIKSELVEPLRIRALEALCCCCKIVLYCCCEAALYCYC